MFEYSVIWLKWKVNHSQQSTDQQSYLMHLKVFQNYAQLFYSISCHFFKGCHPFGMDVKYIFIISHISTLKMMCRHYNKQSCQQFRIFRCSFSALIHKSSIRHLYITNICRVSPIFSNLSGYLSLHTRLPLIAGSQKLTRAIIACVFCVFFLS